MKVRIVNSFKDAETGVIHGAGEEIEMSEDRIKEVEETTKKLIKEKRLQKGTVLIEKVSEDSKQDRKEDEKDTKSDDKKSEKKDKK
ncbi:MAG: hypothetical protein HFG29_10320 [Eubacterium sp.]|nr:hypothetical protein [Eubacterium sp.]